jgi:hypothetical protein
MLRGRYGLGGMIVGWAVIALLIAFGIWLGFILGAFTPH